MHTVGEVLQGRYRIEALLGQGGMGGVYLATHQGLQSKVAVKEMTIDSSNRGAVEQFRREAQMLHLLQHDSLPRVHDFFEEGGRYYLVMDYVPGVTLEETIRFEPASETQVLGWAQTICQVLDYLHNHTPPVIFRDLKPSNIMLGDDGRIKLIDFGIAKNFDVDTGLGTKTTVRGAGTAGFAAPEQYGTGTDERTDIYALGATLYCLLTRTIPPDATDRAGGAQELQPLRDLRPDVSMQTAKVIDAMMSLNRNQRPGSVREVAESLGLSLLDRVSTGSAPRMPASKTGEPPPAGGATVLSAMARKAVDTNRPNGPTTTAPAAGLAAAPATRMLPQEKPPAGPGAKVAVGVAAAALLATLMGGGYWFTHQSLEIDSEPSGADISRPGEATPFAKTPLHLSGLRWGGQVKLTLQHPGYSSQEVTIPVSDGRRNVPLTRIQQTLVVTCDHSAYLIVDGNTVGPITPDKTTYSLDAGRHQLSVRPQDTDSYGAPAAVQVDVGSQPLKAQRFTLRPMIGSLLVHTVSGVMVKVAGQDPQPGPTAQFDHLRPGPLSVIVKGKGYREADRTVNIQAGKNLPLAITPVHVRRAPKPVVPTQPAATHPQASPTVVVMPAPVANPGVTGNPVKPPPRRNRPRPGKRQPRQKRVPKWLQQWRKNHPQQG